MRSATIDAARSGRSSVRYARRGNCSRRMRFGRGRRSSAFGRAFGTRPHGSVGSFGPERPSADRSNDRSIDRPIDRARSRIPLAPMTPMERVMADYAGTSLTIGPHPMALLPRRSRAARRAARHRSARRPLGTPRPGGRSRHHAAAAWHGERIRVPDARGRDRHRQRHRASGSLHRTTARPSSAHRICSSKERCRFRRE